MKKYRRRLLGAAAAVIALAFLGFYFYSHADKCFTYVTKDLTHEQALREAPYLSISDEEYLLCDLLLKSPQVAAAVENGEQADELDVSLGEKLAEQTLSTDVTVSELAVIDETVHFTYRTDSRSVILSSAKSRSVVKTVGIYGKNGGIRYIYENNNNETYRKGSFKLDILRMFQAEQQS